MDYTAPTADQVLAIKVNAGIEELASHERFAAASPDLVEAIVEAMDAFEAEAKSRGATTAFLEVAEDNTAARALYSACGYVQNGLRPGYYVRESGSHVAAMTLCKSLA